MVLVTKVNGRKINNTARDLRLGMMELRIKEFTSMAKSTAKDTSSGETKVNMWAISSTIILKETVHIDGATVEYTKVSGKTTKWRVKAYSHGQMAESILETT